MTTDWGPKLDLLIVSDAERAVVLGETFVEPHRSTLESVFDEQVCVLVKDNVERILFSANLRRQRDVIDVRTGLKITGDVWSRFERRIRAVALEHDDRGRHGRVELHLRKQSCEHFTKLLELQSDFPDVFFIRISQHEEVLRAHTDPRVFR